MESTVKKEKTIEVKGYTQFVVFKLAEEEYGIDIQRVIEIVELTSITRVPNAPSFVKGVINLRGEIIPVMGLRERFNLPPIEQTDETRIVIFKVNEGSIGMIVDNVVEVVEIHLSAIEGVSNFSNDDSLKFLYGVGKIDERIVTLLNLDKLVVQAQREG